MRHSPCQGRVIWDFSANQNACFAAGTPIKLPDGSSKPIEEFQIGDAILTRHEWDVDGELRAGTVSAVWKTEAFIYNLHVGDGYIETTRDHPFYVKDFGWKTAYELRAADELRTSHGWVVCRGVADSGRTETVYNVTVAQDHTYFVGGETWGFAVWVHNGKSYRLMGGTYNSVRKSNRYGEVHHIPAAQVTPLSYHSSPAIWMSKADHRKTASWGSSKAAEKYRAEQANLIAAGRYEEAVRKDILDIRSKFGNKYDKGITDMLATFNLPSM